MESKFGYRGILALATLSFIYFLENYDRSLIAVSPIPYIDYQSYGYSLLTGTLFASVYTTGGLFFSLCKSLTNRKIWAIAIACLVFSTASILTALANNFWQQAMIRLLMGLGQSIVTPFASGIISGHFEAKSRGIAFSIFNFGTYLSFSMTLSLGTFMYDSYGWRAGYVFFGMIGIAVGLLTPLLVTEKFSSEKSDGPEVYSPIIDQDLSYLSEQSSHNGLVGDKDSFLGLQDMVDVLREVFRAWNHARGRVVYLLCGATGLRLGAGYVWVAYTSVYFSELWTTESDSSCTLSYDASLGSQGSGICGEDYPYCRGGSYEQDPSVAAGWRYVGGECSSLTDMPWHNQGVSHADLQTYMSWVPLVGSGIGSLLGGYLSDRACSLLGSRAGRPLVAGVSSMGAVPFVVLALYAGNPACFLYFIPSGLIGEMYIGASLALVSDLTSPGLVTPSVALFMFLVTILGGNAPFLVPMASSLLPDYQHTFAFSAAPPAGTPPDGAEMAFAVQATSGRVLRDSLLIVVCSLYVVSSAMYLLCAYILMQEGTSAPEASGPAVKKRHLDQLRSVKEETLQG